MSFSNFRNFKDTCMTLANKYHIECSVTQNGYSGIIQDEANDKLILKTIFEDSSTGYLENKFLVYAMNLLEDKLIEACKEYHSTIRYDNKVLSSGTSYVNFLLKLNSFLEKLHETNKIPKDLKPITDSDSPYEVYTKMEPVVTWIISRLKKDAELASYKARVMNIYNKVTNSSIASNIIDKTDFIRTIGLLLDKVNYSGEKFNDFKNRNFSKVYMLTDYKAVTEYIESKFSTGESATFGSVNAAYVTSKKVSDNKIVNNNKINKKNEGGNIMNFNFKKLFGEEVGKDTSGKFKLCVYGVAIKDNNGTYVYYDKDKNELLDVMDMVFDFDFIFKFPTSDVKVNDLIIVNGSPVYVTKVENGVITVVNPIESKVETVMLKKNALFNAGFVVKVLDFSSMMPGLTAGTTAGADGAAANPMASMMPFLFMSSMGDNNGSDDSMSKMMPMLMMSQLSGGAATGTNPMMMMALYSQMFGGASDMSSMMPMMFMMNGGMNLFGAPATAATGANPSNNFSADI